jgi:uncharacterized phiE125 gp8 family phage protein
VHYAIKVVTPPAAEPLSLLEAKSWVRSVIDAEDADVLALIRAARQRAEKETERALVTQTLRLTLDRFPDVGYYGRRSIATAWGRTATRTPDVGSLFDGELIYLPRPALQSVLGVTYVDTQGVTQTLDPSAYQVDAESEPGRLMPAYGQVWPATRDQLNAAAVTYLAGYGDAAAVPEEIKLAMRLMIGHWYEHREEVGFATLATAPIPLGAAALLSSYWAGTY